MKILPVTCIWGRKEVTQIWLDQINRLGFKPLICYSKPQDLPEGEYHKIQAKNEPLSNKWQALIDEALNIGADYYQILGSDGIPSERYYERFEFSLNRSIRKRHKLQFYGLESTHLLDTQRGFLHYYKYGKAKQLRTGAYTIGGGRMYSDRILKLINPIYPENKNSGLDKFGEQKAKQLLGSNYSRFYVEPADQDFIGCLGLKTGHDMHPIKYFEGKTERINGNLVHEFFDLDIIQRCMKLPALEYDGVLGPKLAKNRKQRGIP